MNANLSIFVVIWVILASVVIALAISRKLAARKEDDSMHFRESETGLVTQQFSIAQRLDVIDRWGQALTAVALGYGLVIAAVYLYLGWVESTKNLSMLQ